MDPGLAWMLLVGLAAGIVSGLLGVGGGIVIVPVLHYIVGLEWPEAVALSLFVIAVQAPVGVWRHARKEAVSYRIAVPMVLGGAVGVAVGHVLLPVVPVVALKLGFAGLLVFGAWRLHAGRPKPHAANAPIPVLVAVGLGAGLVSRLLGVGGGIVTVPLLGILGTPVHLAVGSSLVPVFTNAAVASGANLAEGLAWRAGIPLAIGAVAGSLAGVRIAHALPEAHLRKVVGIGMLAVAAYIALTAW